MNRDALAANIQRLIRAAASGEHVCLQHDCPSCIERRGVPPLDFAEIARESIAKGRSMASAHGIASGEHRRRLALAWFAGTVHAQRPDLGGALLMILELDQAIDTARPALSVSA